MAAAGDDDRPWLEHYPEDVPATIDVPAAPATALLDDAVAAFPDAGALTFAGRTLTYRALAAEVDRITSGLAGQGVSAGDRVALLLPNCPQHVIALFAIWRLGATAVECDPLGGPDELRDRLAETGASAVVCLDQVLPVVSAVRADTSMAHVVVTSLLDYYPRVHRLRLLVPLPQVRRRRREIAAPVPSEADVVRFSQLVQTESEVARADVDADSVAVIYFTGGTVADAHAVPLTHANLVAQAHQLRAWLVDARPGRETTLGVLPMFHAFGLAPTVLVTVLLAGRLALLPSFDTDRVFAALDREQPSYLPGVPPMFRSLLASQRLQSHDLRSLRRCLSIGRTLPVDAVTRFERLSGARLVEAYGLTEAAGVTHAQPMHGDRQPGALLPLPGTDARIVDPRDADRSLDVGERGELAVRGPQISGDEWLPTGDLAVMDEDGWFTFVERKDDVVTAGLLKVVPADVERALFELAGVEDCCVVGAATGRRTTVVAYVVPASGATLTEDAVRSHLADRLPAKQQPTAIEFRTELPRSVIGHARRRDLVIPTPTPSPASKSSGRPPARSRSAGRTGPASPDLP